MSSFTQTQSDTNSLTTIFRTTTHMPSPNLNITEILTKVEDELGGAYHSEIWAPIIGGLFLIGCFIYIYLKKKKAISTPLPTTTPTIKKEMTKL